MPNYYPNYFYNPGMSGVTGSMYPQNYSMQQNYGSQAQQVPQVKVMEWVEGEVGAKAFQMPAGWPPNQPIPLWDNSDTVIWMKSWNQMGVPNPIQKLKYEMENQPNIMLPQGQSGAANNQNGSMTGNYATKEEIEQIREGIHELREMLKNQSGASTQQNNQNGNNQNRGGGR